MVSLSSNVSGNFFSIHTNIFLINIILINIIITKSIISKADRRKAKWIKVLGGCPDHHHHHHHHPHDQHARGVVVCYKGAVC